MITIDQLSPMVLNECNIALLEEWQKNRLVWNSLSKTKRTLTEVTAKESKNCVRDFCGNELWTIMDNTGFGATGSDKLC